VILSWEDTLSGCRRPTSGHNLVIHEFAHQLDMRNGRIVDGTPVLQSAQEHQRWIRVLGHAFDRHVAQCRRGFPGVIDCYGATNPAEFFAVISEAFFEEPNELREQHEDIYEVLRDFYHLDPQKWYR